MDPNFNDQLMLYQMLNPVFNAIALNMFNTIMQSLNPPAIEPTQVNSGQTNNVVTDTPTTSVIPDVSNTRLSNDMIRIGRKYYKPNSRAYHERRELNVKSSQRSIEKKKKANDNLINSLKKQVEELKHSNLLLREKIDESNKK